VFAALAMAAYLIQAIRATTDRTSRGREVSPSPSEPIADLPRRRAGLAFVGAHAVACITAIRLAIGRDYHEWGATGDVAKVMTVLFTIALFVVALTVAVGPALRAERGLPSPRQTATHAVGYVVMTIFLLGFFALYRLQT